MPVEGAVERDGVGGEQRCEGGRGRKGAGGVLIMQVEGDVE